mmetsp:Transcript_2643/g.9576  ORF Transcript_2643/g.9576 Transcript_2643/m.9576 type:complete len:214 (+) Transcript_2643:2175-2816(+)
MMRVRTNHHSSSCTTHRPFGSPICRRHPGSPTLKSVGRYATSRGAFHAWWPLAECFSIARCWTSLQPSLPSTRTCRRLVPLWCPRRAKWELRQRARSRAPCRVLRNGDSRSCSTSLRHKLPWQMGGRALQPLAVNPSSWSTWAPSFFAMSMQKRIRHPWEYMKRLLSNTAVMTRIAAGTSPSVYRVRTPLWQFYPCLRRVASAGILCWDAAGL